MTKPMTLGLLAIVAVVIAGAAAWWMTREPSIDHTDRALVARGEPLYAQHCAACHGARLEGQPDWQSRNAQGRLPAPPHDASGHTWHHDDVVLFEVTKYGIAKHAPPGYQSDMPGFGDQMGDDDIIATLAYVKSHWPSSVHEKRSAAGMR